METSKVGIGETKQGGLIRGGRESRIGGVMRKRGEGWFSSGGER